MPEAPREPFPNLLDELVIRKDGDREPPPNADVGPGITPVGNDKAPPRGIDPGEGS
ncbi:MAG TPA: hypothetical protein VGR07_20080 [Thermoanaerobaculia bacterium]|jgi:hypothetical protein|nr:hypothetical protein [Thermoanaerobaculia bacterium]